MPGDGIVRILGIDPGSRATGWGVVDCRGNETAAVEFGVIRTSAEASLSERLHEIAGEVRKLCDRHGPDEVVVEEVFAAHNVRSALVLGQVRGAIMVSIGAESATFEYAARKVKKAVVGYGQADKRQMVAMVQRLLGLEKAPAQDAADALALALCHAASRRFATKLEGAR